MPKSSKMSDSLKTAFAPDAWEKFEALTKAAAKTDHVRHEETASKKTKGPRSAPLTRKTPLKRTPLKRKTSLTRRPK